MAKKHKKTQAEPIEKSIAYRQSMIDFFKCENGETFEDMCKAVDPKSSHQKVMYHFHELRTNGYFKCVGLKKGAGRRGSKLWVTVRDKYVPNERPQPYLEQNYNVKKEENPSLYVDGVMKVKMRHVPRLPAKKTEPFISSSMAMF